MVAPRSLICAADRSRLAWLRKASTKVAPSSANVLAIPLHIPVSAPDYDSDFAFQLTHDELLEGVSLRIDFARLLFYGLNS